MVFARFKRFTQDAAGDFIALRTERLFKQAVADYTSALTAPYFREMAERGYTIESVLAEAGKEIPPHKDNRGVAYLMALPDDKIVELIREVAPVHAQVLDEYPEFRASTINGLKRLAAAAAQ